MPVTQPVALDDGETYEVSETSEGVRGIQTPGTNYRKED